jgi:NitT/TauT family transport system permease protein
MAVDARALTSGLDALDSIVAPRASRGRRLWRAAWPKLLAIAIVLGGWELLVVAHWRPSYQLASPADTFRALGDSGGILWESVGRTLGRAAKGYALALVVGTGVGALVARIPVLRAAIGSMITGLQTMPSVAWFPFALVLFKLSQGAILFVVVIGAAPAIANGLVNGIDHIPPVLLRAGRVLGARRFDAFRYVVLPAALPAFVGGLKQGWAFAWRSLLAAEIIGGIPGYSLGQQLQASKDGALQPDLQAVMIVIFVIGVVMDLVVFGQAERWIRRRYGLVDTALES